MEHQGNGLSNKEEITDRNVFIIDTAASWPFYGRTVAETMQMIRRRTVK